jgi:competence protein ComEC
MRKLLPIILIATVLAFGIYLGYREEERKPASSKNALVVRFLDAKHGNAIVISIPGGNSVVIDPGPEATAEHLTDYLRGIGTKSVTLIVTYPSREHVGAINQLVESFSVKRILHGGITGVSRTWDSVLELAAEAGIPDLVLCEGDLIKLSPKVKLEILSPPRGFTDNTAASSMNNSLVARVSVGRVRFLLTSHIGTEVEGKLIQSDVDLRSNVLLVPRHGAAGSTSLEFISQVRPECFIVLVGKGDDRPSSLVMRRISTENTGAQVYRTDRDGPIDVISDGRSIEVIAIGRKR